MGYDSSVYLIYGICFDYDSENYKDLMPVLEVIVPDIIKEYGDDVWSCFDENPHTGGYYCLNFSGASDEMSRLFVALYFHKHE